MENRIERAIDAYKEGNLEQARNIILSFLKENPKNELAWTLLYKVSENKEERIYALKQILEINPENQKARCILEKYQINVEEEKPKRKGTNIIEKRSSQRLKEEKKPSNNLNLIFLFFIIILGMIIGVRFFYLFDLPDAVMSIVPIIGSLIVAVIMGILIYYVYSKSFRGVIYNHGFAVSLALMTTMTTMITLAISSNIALSLGMVGALSIVRYRTAIKDPMDLIFLFWAVATGITIGAKMHYLAVVCALFVVVVLYFINRPSINQEMFILVVHYSGMDVDNTIRRELHGKRYQIKSKTMRKNDIEMAIEIVVKNNNIAFLENINALPEVNDAVLIQYNGEYHG
jgi:hypothetical protein